MEIRKLDLRDREDKEWEKKALKRRMIIAISIVIVIAVGIFAWFA